MRKTFPVLLILLSGVLLLCRPERAAEAVRDGLALCAGTVIPSLFPFFVVVSLLLKLGLADCLQGIFAPLMRPLFRMRGVCALPLLTGLLGGYPAGVRAAAELYHTGQLNQQEAELLLGFCDNCGPAFLMGYVGAGILGSANAGLWLYLIHSASALLTGVILCRIQRDRGPGLLRNSLPVRAAAFPQALTESVSGALASMLQICGFVVLFRVLAALLPEGTPGLGALEMVSGIAGLVPGQTGFLSAAAIVGWGGLSVHCQAMAVAAPEGLSFRWHWAGKTVQAVISVILAAAVWRGFFS
ncbi:MAG: sporulation protein [Oscillospiraceae bacterium]|nr:sporulation protein [Oscillospiraceae bacterium]